MDTSTVLLTDAELTYDCAHGKRGARGRGTGVANATAGAVNGLIGTVEGLIGTERGLIGTVEGLIGTERGLIGTVEGLPAWWAMGAGASGGRSGAGVAVTARVR
jgi:hypothetical protein